MIFLKLVAIKAKSSKGAPTLILNLLCNDYHPCYITKIKK
jgi:hypothetical protein